MKDKDWELLYELYKNPNITKVANKLYMAQPTVTKRLQAIEAELKVDIVNRSSKGVEFTPAGQFIAEVAKKQMAILDELHQGLKTYQMGKVPITLGVSYTFSKFHLPEILVGYTEIEPDTKFQILNEPSDELYQRMLDGTIDAAFVRGDYSRALEATLIGTTPGYIVSKHPVSIGELFQIPYLEYRQNVKTKDLFAKWWHQYHAKEQLKGISVGYIDSVWQFVDCGLGYTLCFSEQGAISGYDFCMQPMYNSDGTPVLRNTWFVYPKAREREPDLGKFIRYINSSQKLTL